VDTESTYKRVIIHLRFALKMPTKHAWNASVYECVHGK